MISILIPVYNYEIGDLVRELCQQIVESGKSAEVILVDDGSDEVFKKKNRVLAQLPFVSYTELPENIGRQRIRQRLSAFAKYEYLLFLDCDGLITRKDFLDKYISCLDKAYVIAGGRIYSSSPPENCSQRLHWKYGIKRESINPRLRNDKPYLRFMTNNFLISRKIFEQLVIPVEWFHEYGHEDTYLGLQLQKRNASILHIDNPVLHSQLEDTQTFIEKSKAAVRNLALLSQGLPEQDLKKYVKLYRTKERIEKMKLGFPVNFLVRLFKRKIINNLKSCNPSLFLFDLYRLSYFLEKGRKNS